MISLHEWPETIKGILDRTALAGAVISITLSQVALYVSIAAGLLSAAWVVQRFVDRYRFGPGKQD